MPRIEEPVCCCPWGSGLGGSHSGKCLLLLPPGPPAPTPGLAAVRVAWTNERPTDQGGSRKVQQRDALHRVSSEEPPTRAEAGNGRVGVFKDSTRVMGRWNLFRTHKWQAVCQMLNTFPGPSKVRTTWIIHSQMRELRLREVNTLAHSHTANTCQSWD